MKLQFKISLWTACVAFVISLLVAASAGGHLSAELGMFAMFFGAGCFVGGFINLFLAAICFLAKSKVWGKGFLLSAGIMLLIGTGICSPIWLGVIH